MPAGIRSIFYVKWIAIFVICQCSQFKYNPNTNCLDATSSCFKRDTTPPTVNSSPFANGTTIQSTTEINTLTFSEPVNNADNAANYKFSGLGGANLTVTSVTKIDDRNYQLNISGGLQNNSVVLTLSPNITDWAGNKMANSTLTYTGNVAIGVTLITALAGNNYLNISNTFGTLNLNFTWQSDTAAEQYFVNIVSQGAGCPALPTSSNSTGAGNTGTVPVANSNMTTQIKASDMASPGFYDICIFVNKTSSPTKSGGSVIVSFSRDDTRPTITAVTPASSTIVTTPNVGYTLSKTCPSGTITWTRTGGAADAASPHGQSLVALSSELSNTASFSGSISNAPALVSGSIYSIAFNVTDYAGNPATTVTQTSVTYDTTGPTPGGGGALSYTALTSGGLTVNWTVAADNVDASTALQYLVYYSLSNNINNVANAQANGTPFGTYSTNISSKILTGLQPGTSYYFNVLVKDTAGNISSYTSSPGTTAVDGATWTARTMPSSSNWRAIAYGNGVFVAVVFGSNVAATSPDGVTWTPRVLPATSNWQAITFGNGIFVAISYMGFPTATSPDGITWTPGTMLTNSSWTAVGAGPGLFVAVAQGPSNIAATSPDGITWTTRSLPSIQYWYGVVYGSGQYVAVSGGSSTVAATSPDGATWTARVLPTAADWQAVTFGAGMFAAVATGLSTAAASSPDGITWTARVLPTSNNWRCIAWGNNVFITLGDASSAAATSPDGMTWTARTLPSSANWQSIAFGNNIFVTPAYAGSGAATTP